MQDSTGFTGSYNEPPIETPHLNSKVDHDEASVNAIASWLDQLPPVETMTTAAVVKKLIPSIKKMQAKGYSIDQIAAELSRNGLPVSGRTLARHVGTRQTAKRRAG